MSGSALPSSQLEQQTFVFYPEAADPPETKKMSFWQIVMVSSFNYPFGALCGPMGVAILPLEAERLGEEQASLYLGAMMGIVGVTQLVCPFAGIFSDVHKSKLGKRRPYVFGGGIVSAVSIAGMMYCSHFRLAGWFFAFLTFSMTGLNVAYTASYGLVPDLVPQEDQGLASGIVGALQLFGSLSGFVFLISTYSYDYHVNYLLYIAYLCLSMLMIYFVAKEKDTSNATMEPISYKKLALSYTIDCRESYDFLWVFIGRTFYYIGISCQSFVLFFVRDVINVEDVAQQKYHVGAMALLAQMVGGAVAVNAGKLSDNPAFGRKKLVYFACTIMAAVYILWLATPWIFCNEVRFYLNHLEMDQYFKKYMPKARKYFIGKTGHAEEDALLGGIHGDEYGGAQMMSGRRLLERIRREEEATGFPVAEQMERGREGLASGGDEDRSPATSSLAESWSLTDDLLSFFLREQNVENRNSELVHMQTRVGGRTRPDGEDITMTSASNSKPRNVIAESSTTSSSARVLAADHEETATFTHANLLEQPLLPSSGAGSLVLDAAAPAAGSSSSSSSKTTKNDENKDGDDDEVETMTWNLAGNSHTTQGMELMFMYGCMCVYGVGNGAYLAVDLALALDCLPDPSLSAQSLGIWGVSAFVGLAIGPLLWGSALELSGGKTIADNVRVYPYTGYVYILLGGCVFCFMAGAVVRLIKKST